MRVERDARLRADLARIGERRQSARAAEREASEAIGRLALLALKAGMSKSEIARVAQVSRPALDEMLTRARKVNRA